METNCETVESKKLDFWKIIEKVIKSKESAILIFLILASFVYIPLKIISYGWAPTSDATRHVAFATLDAKWSDILVIDEKFDIDHNAGWHQILKFLHKRCNFDKQDLMLFSIIALFLFINISGLICSPSPICWCVAILIMSNIESNIWYRLLIGRPYIVSCASTLIVLCLWSNGYNKCFSFCAQKNWLKYLITLVALTLGVWIHGSWYLFLLIPISFFIAGKNIESLKLTACIFISTLIGAFLTGNFCKFLYYHFFAVFTIYSEHTFNWLLVTENATGNHQTYWIIFTCLIIFLCMKKNDFKLASLSNDPVFVFTLLSWLGSIFVIRFWLDWGRIALLLFLSHKIGDLISKSISLKEPRIRYCLTIFVIVSMNICFTNDYNGRFTKIESQPIDFYNDLTIDKLKGWAPQDGGIIYSTSMRCFYDTFYQYPNKKWKYILGFEAALMKPEDKAIYRNIGYSGLEEDYLPWIDKMTDKDRLILNHKLNKLPQLEWIQGSRTWWIGRLKKTSDETNSIASEKF